MTLAERRCPQQIARDRRPGAGPSRIAAMPGQFGERATGGQRIEGIAPQPGALRQIGHIAKRPCGGNTPTALLAKPGNLPQPEPNRAKFDDTSEGRIR